MELSTIGKLPATSSQPFIIDANPWGSRATPTVIEQAAHWGSVSTRVDTTSIRRPQPWSSLNVLPSPDVRRIEERESIDDCCRQTEYYLPLSQ